MFDEFSPYILYSNSIPANEQSACDCACPEIISHRTIATTTWQHPEHIYLAALNGEYTVAFNPLGQGIIAALDSLALSRLESFAIPHALAHPADRQLVTLGLLSPTATELPAQTPQTLTAWLHLTEACNLRCAYCYVHHSPRTMDEVTGIAAVDAVFRSAVDHGYRAVKLKYAGGEPTLAWSLLSTLHCHAQALSRRTGLALFATVLSNGTQITPAMLDWFAETGVRLMLSLDGVGTAHNAQRPFVDGRGSFAAVENTIGQALARDIHPYISITITGQNVTELAETVRYIMERGLPFHFNFSRASEEIERLNIASERTRWLTGLQEAMATAISLSPDRRVVDNFLDLTSLTGPHLHPCGAGRHYLVIDPVGRVAPCQMLLEAPVTDIWAKSPLTEMHLKPQEFSNPSVETKSMCRSCPWKYVCAGGCPLLSKRIYGSAEHASPHCFLYRELLPILVRYEGKRLLNSANIALN